MPKSQRERRGGQYGNKRGKPDIQLARRRAREEKSRVRESLEEAKRAREALDRRMAREAASPALGRVSGATWSARQRELEREEQVAAKVAALRVPRHVRLGLPDPDAQGNGSWTMGQARSLLRAGYHLHHVQKMTGWGEKCFDDMKVDLDGYGLPIE